MVFSSILGKYKKKRFHINQNKNKIRETECGIINEYIIYLNADHPDY